jgi:HD-like signal output (HDOD) protein
MDAAVCAKVLQLVNSAYFGLGQKIVSIRPAVTYLGVEIIKSLVLGSTSFSTRPSARSKASRPTDCSIIRCSRPCSPRRSWATRRSLTPRSRPACS